MENKVLVKLYLPELEIDFDIYLPISKRIGNIINLIIKAINEMGYYYNTDKTKSLYSRNTGEKYLINSLLYDTNIRNGSELVLL